MAHRIIISSGPAEEGPHATLAVAPSLVEFEFTFTPSHALPEKEVDRRAARIRKVLLQLQEEVSAAPPLAT